MKARRERRSDAIDSYRDLKVWQRSVDLVVACYRLTAFLPEEEVFGPTAQIRASAASIAANIAEGHGQETTGSFVAVLGISQGSLKELETHLLIATRVGFIAPGEAEGLEQRCDEIGKMIRALLRSLQGRSK